METKQASKIEAAERPVIRRILSTWWGKVLCVLLALALLCGGSFGLFIWQREYSGAWEFRDIVKKMKSVQYGRAIARISVAIQGGCHFSVSLIPDRLTTEEELLLNSDLITLLVEDFKARGEQKRQSDPNSDGVWYVRSSLHITTEPEQEHNRYYYTYDRAVPTAKEMQWCFSMTIDGQTYTGNFKNLQEPNVLPFPIREVVYR